MAAIRFADVTCVQWPQSNGFVYLAAIMDAWARRIVGYALGRGIDASLTLAALTAPTANRNPPPGRCPPLGQGLAVRRPGLPALLGEHGLIGLMGRRGNPYDNAMMESFMKTLKVEGVYPMAFESADDVVGHLPRLIDRYNERRLRSALGYPSPNRFEEEQPRRPVKAAA